MKCRDLVWIFAVSGAWIVTGDTEADVCASGKCADSEVDDGIQVDSALSLLQVASTAERSMPARVQPSRDSIAGGGRGRDGGRGQDGLDFESASKTEQHFKLEQRAFNQNHATRYMFPLNTSSPQEVEDFFILFGDDVTGWMMKNKGIDGKRFLNMKPRDFEPFSMHEYDRDNILTRIKTRHAQDGVRREMMKVASNRKTFTGISALHDIVGPDGVLMITLDRMSERFNESARVLGQVGIKPTRVSAVDMKVASKEELARGCPKQGDPGVKEQCEKPQVDRGSKKLEGKAGFGCMWPTEQAVAASHRKALEIAKERDAEWTAIFEDDTVPAPHSDWNGALRDLWSKLPAKTKFVRLGWCQLGIMDWRDPVIQVHYANTTGAAAVEKEGCCSTMYYDPGGCTTAYMVHKDILDEILGVYPCCGPVDSCYKWDWYKSYDAKSDKDRGLEIMMSLDTTNQPLWDDNVEHHGLILQDRENIESAQEIPWGTFDVPGR
mmetsp:Transcript_44658/g.83231  ORF Transcript_44658/g.83231 Transcript_44658/m.83231 type:complete len:493 (-) Transcript_44658:121-1599(-)